MDTFNLEPNRFVTSVFPEKQTELRWEDSDLWPVRRPYPLEVPCPVCGAFTGCGFFGRRRCPRGHVFGQRAFWNGRASTCSLLLEDPRDGRTLVYMDAPLIWRDHARLVGRSPTLRPPPPTEGPR